jgi:phosphomannomutase
MVGISGVRGIVGESLGPEFLARLGQAYGTYTRGGRIVVGRDARVSGEMVKHAVFGGLLSAGCAIVDIGVVATPTATIMIEELRADGGIVISASHNPVEWNGLKFFRRDGIYLNADEGRELLDIYYQGDYMRARWDGFKAVETNTEADRYHVNRILANVDASAIAKASLRVGLDCCNGAGYSCAKRLLAALGCEVTALNCTPDGLFPHGPEPTFENLAELVKLAATGAVDVGFAQDPDADRLAVIAEDGTFLSEEYTLAIVLDYLLPRNRGLVVTNLSTSRMVDRIAARHGCEVLRVPVGEVNVAEAMKEHRSPIGGEGNGGVIDARVHYGRDSFAGMAVVLEAMAVTKKKVSELVAAIPRYHMLKTKVECPRALAREVLRRLKHEKLGACGPGVSVNTDDGLKLDMPDSWVHLRPSNTEPILRIIAEAETPSRLDELVQTYTSRVKKIVAEIE